MGVHQYRILHQTPADFLDKTLQAFRRDEALEKIEAEEINNELAERRGLTRGFDLHVYTIDRTAGDLTVLAQETRPPHTWAHISVSDNDIMLQVVE